MPSIVPDVLAALPILAVLWVGAKTPRAKRPASRPFTAEERAHALAIANAALADIERRRTTTQRA